MRLRHIAVLAGAAFLAACADGNTPTNTDVEVRALAAPIVSATIGQAVPNRYIVVLKPLGFQASNMAAQLIPANAGRVIETYNDALKGFTAELTPAGLAAVRARAEVSYVEQDQVMSIDATQSGATWGLDRIDQANLPLNGTYVYNQTGAGVNVYIVDTGIKLAHSEFGTRARAGFSAINDGRGSDDCNGHGTHVAGTVGGNVYGVAKGVTLYAVRVLDCNGSGTTSGVISGINWVIANRVRPAVANMSLGGGLSSALNTAVANATTAGVTFAVAAGNSNANACNSSPSSAPSAITVGASASNDARASFSNFGSCLDIFAPGVSITSAWYTSNTATAVLSGTSMASPHVAGAAALYLATNPTATVATVTSALTSNATLNKITNPGTSSVNRLLYTGFIGGVVTPPPPPPAAPVAAYTYTCTVARLCTFDGSTSTGSGLTYRWRSSNDGTQTGVIARYNWDVSGQTKTITLTVTDNQGRTSSIAKQVQVF